MANLDSFPKNKLAYHNLDLESLDKAVRDRLQHCFQLAEQHYQRRFSMPGLNYKVRGVKAGCAYLERNEIRLNPILLVENQKEFIHQVIPHELAHLLVFQLFGKVKPHGKEWRRLMQEVFQLEPKSCHQFDVSRVAGKTYAYRCGCQTHALSIRRHNKIQKQNARYHCRKCQQRLCWMGEL